MGRYTGIALDNVAITSGTAVVQSLRNTNNAPPAIKTAATHTVGANENFIIYNGGASNITVTLPAAASFPGRVIQVKNLSGTYTVISASSNVKPANSDSAGTAILAATAGAWAMLVSDGTNWVVMAS
jgi:hypothetical protein